MSDLADFPTIETAPMPAATPPAAAAAKTTAIADSISAVHGEVAKFDQIAAGLARIEAAHPKDVIVADIATSAGFKVAETGWRAYRNPRLEVERARKAAKAPVLALGKAIDTFAGELEARLRDGEDHYKAQIDAEENRRAAEQAEAARIAAERAQKQAEGVAAIRAYLSRAQTMPDMTAERVATGIAMLQGMTFAEGDWLDPVAAANAQCETLEGMRVLQATLKAREEAAAAAEAQRLENERVAKELAEAQARLAAEQQRVARITAMIQEIRDAATGHADQDAAALQEARTAVAALNVGAELYQEFAVVAQAEKAATLAVLDKLHGDAVAAERAAADAEAARVAAMVAAAAAMPALPQERVAEVMRDLAQPLTLTIPPEHKLLAQDVCRDLSNALSADPAAPMHAREAVATIEAAAGDQSAITEAVAKPDPQAAFLALVMSAFDCKFPSHPKPSQEWWAKVRTAGLHLQGL